VLAEESDLDVATDLDSDGEAAAIAVAETDEVFAATSTVIRREETGIVNGDDVSFPLAGIFYNRISGVAHMVKPHDEGRPACGITMNPLTYEFSSHPDSLQGCSLCWRSGCSNWVASQKPNADAESNGGGSDFGSELRSFMAAAEDSEWPELDL
jgi:hypothetical protein